MLKNLDRMENTISEIIKLPDVPDLEELRKNLLIVEQYTKAIEYFQAMIDHYIFSDHSDIPSSLCNELLHLSLGEILLTLPEERFSIYYQLLEILEELRRLGAEEEFETSMKKHMGEVRYAMGMAVKYVKERKEQCERCILEKPFYSKRQ